MTSALQTILDREKPVNAVREHFGDQLWLLRDLANYGSNLIVRCFESSEKSAADVIVLGALVKQAVAMLDGVELHLSNAAVLASHISTRALYEAQLYVLWLLAADTDRRARQYYVWNLRQRRLWASRVIPGTSDFSQFQHVLEYLPEFQSTDGADQQKITELQQHASEEVTNIDQLLNSPKYRSINDAFQNHWEAVE